MTSWPTESETMLYGADDLIERHRAKRIAEETAELLKLKTDFDELTNKLAAKINLQWPKYAILGDAHDRGIALGALEDGIDGILMVIHALETARDKT